MIEIVLIIIGIFLVPILGFLITRFISISGSLIKKGFYLLIILIILFSLLGLIKVYFNNSLGYYYITIFGYLIYCFLIFSIKGLPKYKRKSVHFILGLVPIIIIYLIGFVILPFIGFLSWGINQTYKTEELGGGYVYRIESYGNVSSEWVHVDVYKKNKILPFIHKEIYFTSFNGDEVNKKNMVIDFEDSNEYYKIKLTENDNLNIDTLIKK